MTFYQWSENKLKKYTIKTINKLSFHSIKFNITRAILRIMALFLMILKAGGGYYGKKKKNA